MPQSKYEQLLEYFSTLKVTQGDHLDLPWTLLPWQDRILEKFDHRGNIALTLARGNGKTSFIGGLGAAAIDGPLRARNAEAVVVAGSMNQARIAFKHTRNALECRGHDLTDKRKFKSYDSTTRLSLESKEHKTELRVIGSDPNRAHGLAPSLLIADEPAQWKKQSGEQLWAALRTSMGKIPGSRIVTLGTKAADPTHFFNRQLLNPLANVIEYVPDPKAVEERPLDYDTIRAANPSFDHLPTLRQEIEDERLEAESDPNSLATFKALRLNGGVSEVRIPTLLEAQDWGRIENLPTNDRRGELIWGVDLASGAAMTAVAAYWLRSGRLEAIACFPEIPDLKARAKSDGAGNDYERMYERGELVRIGERAVDIGAFFRHAIEYFGQRPHVVVGDRFKVRDLRQGLIDAGMRNRCHWIPRGMGWRDGGEDVSHFRQACAEGHVRPVQSVLMRAAMANARVALDTAGNAKLAKSGDGLTVGVRAARARDDACAASIVAVAEGWRKQQQHGIRIAA